MAWILQSIFIIVTVATVSKCKHNLRYSLSEDFPQYDHSPVLRRLNQLSYQNNPRIGRLAEGTNKRPHERSFSAHSGTQRVQEQERRRIESCIAEPVTRNDNGSYNFLNNSARRGGSDASLTEQLLSGPTSGKCQDIPEECRRIGICEDVPNYPKELVEKALAEDGDLRSRFQIDQLDIPELPDIGQRAGPSEENQELCYSKLKIVFPKGAVDRNGDFLYILNDDDNPLQGIRVEECDLEKNNGKCNKYAMFKQGTTSTCLQKHFPRILWALENNKVVEKPIPIPSCCSCVVNYTRSLF